jgi:hypothetical protein
MYYIYFSVPSVFLWGLLILGRDELGESGMWPVVMIEALLVVVLSFKIFGTDMPRSI